MKPLPAASMRMSAFATETNGAVKVIRRSILSQPQAGLEFKLFPQLTRICASETQDEESVLQPLSGTGDQAVIVSRTGLNLRSRYCAVSRAVAAVACCF